jgi:hypothetical protein
MYLCEYRLYTDLCITYQHYNQLTMYLFFNFLFIELKISGYSLDKKKKRKKKKNHKENEKNQMLYFYCDMVVMEINNYFIYGCLVIIIYIYNIIIMVVNN